MEDGMSKTKKMPKSPFLGRWRIVSMSTWDEDYINEEFPAFIEFDDKGDGSFQFAYVRRGIDYRITTRDGEPAVEWSWVGPSGKSAPISSIRRAPPRTSVSLSRSSRFAQKLFPSLSPSPRALCMH